VKNGGFKGEGGRKVKVNSKEKVKRKRKGREKRRKEKEKEGSLTASTGIPPPAGLLKSLCDDHSKIGWWEKKKRKRYKPEKGTNLGNNWAETTSATLESGSPGSLVLTLPSPLPSRLHWRAVLHFPFSFSLLLLLHSLPNFFLSFSFLFFLLVC